MKNTTFKRRALLSSVAMLLVALVALGSATFAWFVSDPTATASGLAMKTTTSTGLVIDVQYDGNTDFTHSETLNSQTASPKLTPYAGTVEMSPASMTETGVMKTVGAAASTGYIGKPGEAITAAGATTYYSETIDCQTTDGGAATITKAKVTFTEAASAPAIKSAFRVALLDGTTILATWAPAASDSARYIKDGVSSYPSSAITDVRSVVATGSQQTISVAIGAGSTKTLTLVAYLDGEDGNCYSDLASLAQCFSNIELYLSL